MKKILNKFSLIAALSLVVNVFASGEVVPYRILVKFVDSPPFFMEIELPHHTTVGRLKEEVKDNLENNQNIRIAKKALIVRREGNIRPLVDGAAISYQEDREGSLYIIGRLPEPRLRRGGRQ